MYALVRYTIALCRIGTQAIYNAFSKILDEKEAQKMATSTMQDLIFEGKVLGRVEGRVEGEKDAILRFLKTRFGKIPKTISDTVNSYSDLTALQSLSAHAWACQSLDEFEDGLR